MGKGLETGKSFIQGILAKITDPEAKAAAEKLIGNETALTLIGNGVEGQAEIDRQLSALREQTTELTTLQQQVDAEKARLETIHGQQVEWFDKNHTALEEYKTLKAAPGGGKKVEPPVGGVAPEALQETVTNLQAAFLGYERDQ